MSLAQTEEDVEYDVQCSFKVILLFPLYQKQVDHTLDLLPVLKHVIWVILENALQ